VVGECVTRVEALHLKEDQTLTTFSNLSLGAKSVYKSTAEDTHRVAASHFSPPPPPPPPHATITESGWS
jgi:hypothetical protein